jgi:hypothetical protein
VSALLACLCLASAAALAQRGPNIDQQIVERARLVGAADRVELYQHNAAVDARFLERAEKALARLEELAGRKLDTAILGPKVRIYVSDMRVPSHVWRGYQHPRDPRGIVFLNRLAYEGAMQGTNATYAHEMAHLLTWRYYSHTLREGLADYLALQIHPGAGVGPNAGGLPADRETPRSIIDCLGTTRPAPPEVTENEHYRRRYYAASYRFVKSLIERAGMPTFLRVYDSESPEAEMPKLYGMARADLVRMAGL